MKFTGKDGALRIYTKLFGYVEVCFSNMDFSGPSGRPALEETLVLDRGLVTPCAHYITGTDQVLFDSIPLSFSCILDDIHGINGIKDTLYQALTCRDARNPALGEWSQYGISTKGNSQNIVGTNNPRFTESSTDVIDTGAITTISYSAPNSVISDASQAWEVGEMSNCVVTMTSGAKAGKSYYSILSTSTILVLNDVDIASEGVVAGDTYELRNSHRTVDVELKMTSSYANSIVLVMTEVYFPPEEITITEAEDGITLSCTGGIYGTVTRESDWVAPAVAG